MIRTLMGLLAIATIAAGPSVRAANYSDLWWNPAESGWGINLIQQYDTIFATMFVYGPDGRTSWYVASGLTTSAANTSRFSGPLFETTGPWFGASFNAAAVTNRPVGSMTFTAGSGGASGTLSYTIDGIPITKSIVRQTWTAMPAGGVYATQIVNVPVSGECQSGIALSNYRDMRVNDAGIIGFFDSGGVEVCEINGPITQDGQLKKLQGGTISCPSTAFTGNVSVLDWRVEGGTAFLVGPSALTMTGNVGITAPNGCHKLYTFAGVLVNAR